MTKEQALKRAAVAFALLGLGALAIVGRLVQLQVLQHDRWAALAKAAQEDVVEIPQRRGTIYDRSGLPLARDVPGYSIALDNYHMTKPELLVALLREELGLSPEEAAAKVYRESYFTWLARGVDKEVGDRLRDRARELGIRGLMFFDTWVRTYPQGRLAPEILGVVGVDGHGLEGLELAFDELLRGTPARYHLLRGRDGRVYDLWVEAPGHPGEDLTLTLDARFQRVCEKKVAWGVETFKAGRGFALVMDPRSGAVLALAQYPRYDPEDPELGLLHSWAVTDVFEPGSTFKALVGLAALDQGLITPDTLFNGDSPYIVDGVRIENAEGKSYGTITFRVAIVRSVNTVLVQVALRLGAERLHDYLVRMGFGRPTGIELPGEAAGILKPPEEWRDLDLAVASFGQGVAVTGIQLGAAFCALANGGTLLRPHILPGPPEPVSQVAGQEACRSMRDMMRSAVYSSVGTCRSIRLVSEAARGLEVAAKSGTGQKAIPEGGYSSEHVFGDVVAMFPWDSPRYVILVGYDDLPAKRWDPYKQQVTYVWGGSTAGPTVGHIIQALVEQGLLSPQVRESTELGRSG